MNFFSSSQMKCNSLLLHIYQFTLKKIPYEIESFTNDKKARQKCLKFLVCISPLFYISSQYMCITQKKTRIRRKEEERRNRQKIFLVNQKILRKCEWSLWDDIFSSSIWVSVNQIPKKIKIFCFTVRARTYLSLTIPWSMKFPKFAL